MEIEGFNERRENQRKKRCWQCWALAMLEAMETGNEGNRRLGIVEDWSLEPEVMEIGEVELEKKKESTMMKKKLRVSNFSNLCSNFEFFTLKLQWVKG
ncbi:hypothetical protein SLE2022_118610 [Rubroshorea leprosula]